MVGLKERGAGIKPRNQRENLRFEEQRSAQTAVLLAINPAITGLETGIDIDYRAFDAQLLSIEGLSYRQMRSRIRRWSIRQ